ncbi:MAG: alkaline phosphatase family protein, partial [Planctomycetota bacterium]
MGIIKRCREKIVSINMPMTSPPPQVDGIIVPGLTCPKISRDTVWPPEIYEKHIKHNSDYLIVNKAKQESLHNVVKEAAKTENVRCSLALELMQEIDWDLFSVQIQSTDAFQHKNWYAIDSSVEGFEIADYNQSVEFYKSIDTIIGRLVEAAGDSVLTVIASDHGFCSKKAEIGLNTWLSQNGYLVL